MHAKYSLTAHAKHDVSVDMDAAGLSECLHMLQPSLLSGPERFALGGGRSAWAFLYYQPDLCVAALQHCSVHACGVDILYVAGRQQYGTCSPACMYKSSLTSSFIYMHVRASRDR
jgi:hypothetical protein